MSMWIMIMWTIIAVVSVSLFYLGVKTASLLKVGTVKEWGGFKRFSLGLLITLAAFGLMILCIDFVNAIVCAIYLAMIWAVCDFVFWLLGKISRVKMKPGYSAITALVACVSALSAGWYFDHNVWQTDYELATTKNISDLKMAMIADSHIGTTFDADGFAEHLQKIQAQNPDIVVVVGDYVDDGTSKENMLKATKALGQMKTKYGIYFVFGNHDRGYYGAAHRGFSADELIDELNKNGIKVLRDESVLIDDDFYLIGRRDYSVKHERGGERLSAAELTKDLDMSKYIIVLDHQPVEYDKDAAAKVDLVLSGHTHGGQLFPFNQVGKWIGANDLVYGHERRGNTDFIVTSGISDWAIKFKTSTKSEFVIINLTKGK